MWSRRRILHEIREWAEAIVIALILTLVIRTFVVQAFKIPSGSMSPTLQVGDKLFVNKFVYRFGDPERWDIVVFKYPENRKKDFIKRIVGLEGEEVEIRDGRVLINGREARAPEGLTDNYYFNDGPFGSPGEAVQVPEDAYFVLGDNSASSRDSRYWGFVSRDDLVGKAIFRWWPPRRIGVLTVEEGAPDA